MQAFVENRYPAYQYDYSTLKEVVLDGCRIKALTPEDSQFLSAFQGLVSLSCSCASLTTLIGFPSFPSLRKLELQDNLLTAQSGLDQLSTICPNVRVLRLGGNKIKSAEELITYLTPLKSLVVLDIDKNPFEDPIAQCRLIFFSNLPQLKAIDSINVSGHEWNDDEDDEFEEDEEEGTSEEDEEADEGDQEALKMFYEKDYSENGDDDDDQDDFNPTGVEEEDDEIDEDEDEDNENGDPSESAVPPNKRQLDSLQPDTNKRPKL